jgi:hypothetical protein
MRRPYMFQRQFRTNNPLPLSDIMPSGSPGEVSEWSIVQSWKDCLRQKRNEGSNPSLSEFYLAGIQIRPLMS